MSSPLLSRTRPVPAGEAEALLRTGPDGGFAWIHDGAGLVGHGVAAEVEVGAARAGEAAAELLAAVEVDDPLCLPATGPLVVAALPFDREASCRLVVPALVVARDRQGRSWVTETGPLGSAPAAPPAGGPPPGLEPSRFVLDGHSGREHWHKAVEEALARIASGALSKVVLARSVAVDADSAFHLPTVVERLRRAHPSCFTYAVGGFVGASPELLARRRGALVTSRPMAGTVERRDTVAEDDRALAGMASSSKELSEHRLVVDAVTRVLEQVCEEVSASARPEVARLATVAHLATTVVGRLRQPVPTALELATLLHPTPAVAGAPLAAALQAIADLEGIDRGAYAGPVGWVDSRGDGDWAVAVRCAAVSGATAELYAGAGIVSGSQPAAEWAETQAKLEPMLRALVRV